MTHRFTLRPEAEHDLSNAYDWYEERLQGLGEEFLICVDAAISLIDRHPKLFGVIHKNIVRRALIRRFPYGIFYVLKEDHIVVLAIFHASRDPKSWQVRT